MALDIVVAVLLFLGVALELACVVGVVAMGNVYERMHFVAPSLLGVAAIVVAVILEQGSSQLSAKAALIWVLLAATGPAMAHATVRAARIREMERWSILESEKAEAR
ncbi:MAG TPA: monovalent cation/H(+) antiporter subunit G [Chloroflexota bacterium]|nr:monovalent cation/H(+) antiporter subunit G [Chloroflexota bacterium]